MDISHYASLFAPDTLATLDDVFTSQPDVFDLAFSDPVFADMVRTTLKRSEMITELGMRMRSPIGVLAYMPDLLREPIMTHLSGVLTTETYMILSTLLPILSSMGPALDHFLDVHGYALARTTFRSLGYDMWAFLVAGFAPERDEMLFQDLDDQESTSSEIVEAWGEFLHTL